MTEDELKSIIRQVIADLLAPKPKRALVLFTGGLIGFTDAIESLRRLQATGVELQCIQTPSARRILDQKLIGSLGMRDVTEHLVANHDMLIVPTLTSNIAAKVAHGIADCLASNVVSEFLMSNRPVVASKAPVSPDGAGKKQWYPNVPTGYAEMIRGNLAALESFGVHLTGSASLCRTAIAAFEAHDRATQGPLRQAFGSAAAFAAKTDCQTGSCPLPATGGTALTAQSPAPAAAKPTASNVVVCGQKLLSHGLIQGLPEGTELRVGPNAVITALARDTAATRSIRIVREG